MRFRYLQTGPTTCTVGGSRRDLFFAYRPPDTVVLKEFVHNIFIPTYSNRTEHWNATLVIFGLHPQLMLFTTQGKACKQSALSLQQLLQAYELIKNFSGHLSLFTCSEGKSLS